MIGRECLIPVFITFGIHCLSLFFCYQDSIHTCMDSIHTFRIPYTRSIHIPYTRVLAHKTNSHLYLEITNTQITLAKLLVTLVIHIFS